MATTLNTIINNVRAFFVDLCGNHDKMQQYLLDYKGKSAKMAFIRSRKLSFRQICSYLMNIMSRSIVNEIFHDSELLNIQPVSKQDFSYRRSFISPDIFVRLSDELIRQSYIEAADKLKYWKGYHLLAADGTMLTLPDSDSCRDEFGGDPKAYPSAQALVTVDLMNGLCLSSSVERFKVYEKELLLGSLDKTLSLSALTGHRPLLLLDRGYPSYELFRHLIDRKVRFVVRMQAVSNVVKQFIKSGDSDKWEKARATRRRISDDPNSNESLPDLDIRLVRVRLDSGETEVLATNLSDAEVAPEEFKSLYFLRWGVETVIEVLKNIEQIEVFSGNRPLCVRQDFFARIVTYNLETLIQIFAQRKIEEKIRGTHSRPKYMYKVNRNLAIGYLRDHILQIFCLDRDIGILIENLLKEFAHNTVPIMDGRTNPRRHRRLKTCGKYMTFPNYKRIV